ncbi:DUF2953 domain-containing protein [Clostridium massiliodielmoense]|uniref:DUF2953 domain-containing protein n=1 Tax=Clostridium massiliodielmoense TaxID=1776385 RepID=UPI0004DA0657|nr:DUF2953 domain-containing protein [Clostridium massiliodielmoense]KEH97101.1 hypothetical protein Z962_04715 [Clostridium botulinum C/D str. BKT12695]
MIWLIALFLIFLIPLPLILKVTYENNKLYIYIYNFKVYPSKKTIESMPEPKPKGIFPKLVYINTIKSIYKRFKNKVTNLKLNLDINILYGSENAAITGIFYGLIHSIISYGYGLLSSTFKIKHFNCNIVPKFNNSIFKIEFKSIIFINLGKIIYITILIFLSFKKSAKEYLKPKEVI